MLRNRMKWIVASAIAVLATSGFAFAGAPGADGGCCLPSGFCSFGPEADCIAQDGVYLGDGVPCAGADCRGACCFQDGSCGLGFPALDCKAAGGTWQGVGTDCDAPTECPVAGELGACCDLPGAAPCTQTTEGECIDGGGTWQGAGVPCDPDPCVDEGACCVNDGCVMTSSQQECKSIDGIWQGFGTDCDSVNHCHGACCTDDGCIPDLLIFECEQMMGIWQGAGVPCVPDDPCPELGACCVDGVPCQQLTEDECLAIPGTWLAGQPCNPDPCIEDQGACCIEDPAGGVFCIETTQQDCKAQGGIFQGIGVSCDDRPCEGACCHNDPLTGAIVCSEVELQECDALMGTWYGLGTDCTPPTPCFEGQTGACCVDDPAGTGTICILVTSAECHQLAGTYFGDGSSCVPDPCDDPLPGACCIEDECDGFTCLDLTLSDCAEQGGNWYGAGTDCTTIDDCEPERGACCQEEQPGFFFCTLETASDCQDVGGLWQGAGTDCTGVDVCHIDEQDCGVGACCERAPRFDDPLYAGFSNEITVATSFAPLTFESPITIHDISGRNSAPLGSNWSTAPSYSHASWTLATLGSVFGVALDRDGNIYVTASTAYNADFAGTGGFGAIYKIDAVSAAVSVFATLPNTGPALGNIAYDCAHDQLFVTNMEDGKIYRLDLTGAVLSTFDHGAPDPGTPGFAPLGDRLWAVAAYRNRVYYSVWNEDAGNPSATAANEIWSIALGGGSDGSDFSGVAQLEISIPSLPSTIYSPPVPDISFSTKGCMLIAERSMYSPTSASAHNSRVLEYTLVGTSWTPTTSSFSVGVFSGRNASGGVDYGTDGWPWATGDALQFGPQVIYGIQGFKPGGGTPATSVLIDLNGNIVNQDKTEIGDVEIPCDVCVRPPSRMVAWWPFNEQFGPTANEVIAGNDGTHVGGPTVINGKVGRALRYDGFDDWVRVPNASSLNFGTGDFSIDCWVRTCVTTGINQIVDKRRPTPLRGYSLFLLNGELSLQMADPGGFSNFVSGPPGFVADGEWHLVAVTVDRNNPAGGVFYVDGQPVATFNPTGRPGSLVNNRDLWIGRRHPISTTLQYEGDIDELELFCRVLSAAEVDALWQAGSAGKCRDRCSVPRLTSYCINTSTVVVPLTICNDSAADHQYVWSAAGLPIGSGCSVAGPTGFSPSGSPISGITVPANSCVTIPITVSRPPGLTISPFARSCYEITILNLDTGRELKCRGQLRRVFKWCFTVIDWDPSFIEFPVGSEIPLQIQVTNDADEDGVLDYAISTETHGAPGEESLLSLDGLPPGKPVTGSVTLPIGQSTIIAVPISWLKFEKLRHFDIVISAAQEEGEIVTIGTQALFAEPPCRGDFDADGDVDLVDFANFQLCFTGSSGTAGPECECGKFDDDDDIDLVDFAFFQLAFTGSI